jgi:hypothetical protein
VALNVFDMGMKIILTEDKDAEPGDVRVWYDEERDRIVKEEFEGHPYHSWGYVDAMALDGAELEFDTDGRE